MTPEQFTYWLQGYSEIAGTAPSDEQWKVIRDHLALAFTKLTPNRAPNYTPPVLPGYPMPNLTPGLPDPRLTPQCQAPRGGVSLC